MKSDNLLIAGKYYVSRLLVGTGKYKDFEETRKAIDESGAEIVTVAIRRTNIGQDQNEKSLLDFIPKEKYTYLPNTAGCYSKDEAIRTLRLARELLDGHNLVKLEVLGDPNTLYPNVIETVEAAKTLIKEGFDVMVYTSDDPIIAKQLEDIGCCAIMPLASLIGSGMGILNPHNLEIIIDNAKVPIIVDAGVGTASDAVIAMELGCDGVLMNTAIAAAKDPILMAKAMKKAIESGRDAFIAGRMKKKFYQAAPCLLSRKDEKEVLSSSTKFADFRADQMTKENNAQILIKVTPNFIEKNSMVEFNKYVFSYEVEIKNDSPQSVQLMSRHWIIENSKSEIFEVKGEGVIGEQPTINPGEVYIYSSFTEISTPSGSMWGSYKMLAESEVYFDVEIPKFELTMPRTLH